MSVRRGRTSGTQGPPDKPGGNPHRPAGDGQKPYGAQTLPKRPLPRSFPGPISQLLRFLRIPHPGSRQPGLVPSRAGRSASGLPVTRGPRLTMRGAVGDARPRVGRVGVVRVALRVEVVEEDVHLVGRQQLRGLHVAVRQARVVRVWVLSVQHGGVRHPARLFRSRLHGRRRRPGTWAEAVVASLHDGRGREGRPHGPTPPKPRHTASRAPLRRSRVQPQTGPGWEESPKLKTKGGWGSRLSHARSHGDPGPGATHLCARGHTRGQAPTPAAPTNAQSRTSARRSPPPPPTLAPALYTNT